MDDPEAEGSHLNKKFPARFLYLSQFSDLEPTDWRNIFFEEGSSKRYCRGESHVEMEPSIRDHQSKTILHPVGKVQIHATSKIKESQT